MLRIHIFHPGSRILDPGSKKSRIRINELVFLTLKTVSKLSDPDSDSSGSEDANPGLLLVRMDSQCCKPLSYHLVHIC